MRKESWASDLQREKKSAGFTALQAESLRRKRVSQPPAWTVRARSAPGFNLLYPLVTVVAYAEWQLQKRNSEVHRVIIP